MTLALCLDCGCKKWGVLLECPKCSSVNAHLMFSDWFMKEEVITSKRVKGK
jgi:hypothetical protein